jgi:sulfide:quinone oxidoreductase
MSGRTLVLGGGFGGIAAATELKRLLGDEHEVVLVDRAPRFTMGLRKLWQLVGIGELADGSRDRALLGRHGIEVVQTEVTEIDAADRAAETGAGRLTGDQLVIALGAESRPDLVPGLAEHGHDVWSFGGVPAATAALRDFDGGRIVVLVAGAPYPCPPGPFECAFHLDEHLRGRGLRGSAEIELVTVQPMLMPNAGTIGSAWMADRLTERGVAHRVGAAVERVEAGRVVLDDGEAIAFDLLLAVPPHRPPAVVARSGLLGEHGWVAVDRATLATPVPGVYAVGDVVLIRLGNGLPLPKAGLMAELEGLAAARAIAAGVRGELYAEPFDGEGFCPIEMGADLAGLIRGRFFADPEPEIVLAEPSNEHAAAKRRFESDRLDAWFGVGVPGPRPGT